MAHLERHGVSIALGQRDVSAQVAPGERVVVMGPSRVNKTMLRRSILVGLARALDALSAGLDGAASLGVEVGRPRKLLFATSSLRVGAAIAAVGPIGQSQRAALGARG